MKDNSFLRFHAIADSAPEETQVPSRVHARVDKVEHLNEAPRVFLDAIDADWFDLLVPVTQPRGLSAWWQGAWQTAPLFVIEVDAAELPLPVGFSLPADDQEEDEDKVVQWLTLTLAPQPGPALLYPNLFAVGQRITITSAVPTSPSQVQQLEESFSLDPHVTDSNTIVAELARVSSIDLAAVYDVGQGSSNAACDRNGLPCLYFDLGGGVLGHTATFPSALTDFCYATNPPVTLSHWDWDHWSSGNRFGGAQKLTWLAPNQKIGPTHAAFAQKIAANGGTLRIWPTGLASAQHGQFKIIKCTGTGRNGSGLAVEVTGPNSEDPLLLPGDARYSSVPGALATTYTSIVAPHHGGDMKLRSTPVGSGYVASRFAYSYGVPNSFGHPRVITEQDHHNNQWPHTSRGAALGIERRTCSRNASGLGHLALAWVALNRPPTHRCPGCACGLLLQQT